MNPFLLFQTNASSRAGRRWIDARAFGIVAALALPLAALASCGRGSQYVTEPVTRGPLSVTVHALGRLAARNRVEIGAEISGRIGAVYVNFNDPVKKGQKLAQIDTAQLGAQLAQARASLAQAQATLTQASQIYPRDAALARNGAMSKQALDGAKADLLRARANAALAAAQVAADKTLLAKATIVSPIDGVVLDRKVSPGQTIAAAMQTPVLFTLASDLTQLELGADIREADVGQVHRGQRASFTVDAYPNRAFDAKVTAIHSAPKASRGAVTYTAVLSVANPERLLKPGMTARVAIAVARIDDALLVPDAALRFTPRARHGATMPRVWTVEGGKLTPHDLKLGAGDGHVTQVLAGIAAGDRLIAGYRK